MTRSTDPSKNASKIPQKSHDKAVQSTILWLNSNKIGEINNLQSANKQGNPSFHFHAQGSKPRYPCTETASAVPKYFPCLLQFCTGYRIWHASRVWKRKTSEKRWFTHSKKYPDTIHAFSLFLDEFLETDLRPIYDLYGRPSVPRICLGQSICKGAWQS